MCILKSALKLSVGPESLVTPIWCILSHPASDCMNQVKSLLSMRGMLLGYGLEPRPTSRALGTEGSAMTTGLSINGC